MRRLDADLGSSRGDAASVRGGTPCASRDAHGTRDARKAPRETRREGKRRRERGVMASLASLLTIATAFGGFATVRGAMTPDVCYGASWLPTTTSATSETMLTVRPVRGVPKDHPLYEDAFAKACLGFANSSAAEPGLGVVLPQVTDGSNMYWSSVTQGCASAPTVSAGQLFYNRAVMGSTASYAESNTGLERDKTVRIVFLNDNSTGAHVVVLAGAKAASRTTDPEVGLMMESNALKNTANVKIEEPRGIANQVTSGTGCDPSTSSTTDCYELDTDLGIGKFRFGSHSAQRGIVIGHVSDVNAKIAFKFTLLSRITSVQLASFDEATFTLTWHNIPLSSALRGFTIRSAECTDHCLSHTTCASCAADDACGYCDGTCSPVNSTCNTGFDVVGECLDTCGAARTCGECAERSDCGWCHTTGRCTATSLDKTSPQDGTCSAFSVSGDATVCETCPGAIASTGLPVYVDTDPVWAFCNGRGTCDNSTKECSCANGYGGEACEKMCPGGAENPCSRNGVCESSSGECFCNPGYSGARCHVAAIVGSCECGSSQTYLNADGTQELVCTGRRDDDGSCACRDGWSGANCDSACPGASSISTEVCGGHGTCNSATGQCDCDPCYTRDLLSGMCVQDTCTTCDENNGVCACVAGSMQCVCRGAFEGYSCDQCNCGANGRCNALSGECECDTGYAGANCEVETGTVTCSGASQGSWNSALGMCICKSGYTGSNCQHTCTDCNGHGVCSPDDGSCSCFSGFTGTNCAACADGYEPYPICGKNLAAGECSTGTTADYGAGTNVSMSGRQCQPWASANPWEVDATYATNVANTLTVGNECRNPSGDTHPWCYVDYTNVTGSYTRGEPRWEFCSVPSCKAAYVSPPKICAVLGAETVVPFERSSTSRDDLVTFNQVALSSTTDNCNTAIGLSHNDVLLHDAFVARLNEDVGASGEFARRYIERVGLKADSGGDWPAVEIHHDGNVYIGGIVKTASLPWSSSTNHNLCVSDWKAVSSGLSDAKSITITHGSTVANITKVQRCSSCQTQLIIVISVPDSVTTNTGICSTADDSTSTLDAIFTSHVVTDGTEPWTTDTPSTHGALTASACNTLSYSVTAPSESEARWCDQCQYLGGLYGSCVDTMENEGFDFARAAFVEGCRMAFVATYGYDRTIASYLTEESTSGATLEDTVFPYREYAKADAFLQAVLDERTSFTVEDVTDPSFPLYIVGESKTDGSFTRLSGLPRDITGETLTTQVFPYPRIEDACRNTADIGATSGYRVYTMNYESATDETLEITMCGSATGTTVGIYETQYADDLTHAHAAGATGTITATFTPWISGLATYELRFKYESIAALVANVTFDVTRGSTALGTFVFYPPITSTGEVGFEFNVPTSESGSQVTLTLTPTSVSDDSTHVSLLDVSVRGKNYVQDGLGYPPFGGVKQVACANFQATSCGSLKFLATQKTYSIVVSGRRGVSGAFSMQIRKVRADLSSVSMKSLNPATSLVRSITDATGVLTPYKKAKYGDNVRVVARATKVIDKPIIKIGSYTVPSGLILSSAGGAEWSATVTITASMETCASSICRLTISVEQSSSVTLPSRGFKSIDHPLGSDIALVVLDNEAITVSHALIVNPAYMLGTGDDLAPTACTDLTTTDGKNVNITAAKYAKVGDYVAIIFEPSEAISTLGGNIAGEPVVRWVEATAPRELTLAVEAYRTSFSATIVEVAYARVSSLAVGDGVVPFSITFTDDVGNAGDPITSAINSLTGVTASSSLIDRLAAGRLLYDKTAPRPVSWSLSYLDSTEMSGNQGSKPASYHSFGNIASSAKEYRVGDTVVISGTWSEYVTRPYGAYLRSSASSGVHVPQSSITMSSLGSALVGKAMCMATEFRPRTQESISTEQGFGGTDYELSTLHRAWKVQAQTVDPCDLVGKGALAWSVRADCQAEVYGDNALWIPLWSAWCRHGWGTLGYSILGGLDAAGNPATALRKVSKSPDNSDATVIISKTGEANDIILRTPIAIAGKEPPGWLDPVPRGDWTSDPKVVELYIEPQTVRWNEYRRVVKIGDVLQIQLYTDQPVKAIRATLNNQALPAATHPAVASAMKVEKPCAQSPNMKTWLGARGLLALEAEEYNDGSFASDDEWLDWLMQTSYEYEQPVPNVPNYPNAYVLCKGFWVQRGLRANGKRFSVRRLCPNRHYLRISSYAAQGDLTCTDDNDRIYKPTDAYNYWVINFRYTSAHQTAAVENAPLKILWQVTKMDDSILPTSSTWYDSDDFFTQRATDDYGKISELDSSATDATGPAFDASESCGRNFKSVWNTAGSAVWVSKDTIAPSLVPTDSSVYVANRSGRRYPSLGTEHVALEGDFVTLTLHFDEHIASGLYITVNDEVTARATSVNGYDATFTFEVTGDLAALNAIMSVKIFNLQDIQQANTAGSITATTFGSEQVQLQSANEIAAITSLNTCDVLSDNAVTTSRAKHGDTVTITVKLPAPPNSDTGSMTIHDASVAGEVKVKTPTSTSCTADVCEVILTSEVDSASTGFVDGNVVSWSLVAIARTECAHNNALTCTTRFKLRACTVPAPSAVWVDFTPPTLLSVDLKNDDTNDIVLFHGHKIQIDIVSSEDLHSLTYTASTSGLKCKNNLVSARSISLTGEDGTDTTAALTLTYNAATLHCVLERICITFVGTDLAGHSLTNPKTCRSFSPTSSPHDPGWFMLHNAPGSVVFDALEAPLGLNCMDSSVDSQECATALVGATLEHGNYMQLKVSSDVPIAITDVKIGTIGLSPNLPYDSDSAWTMTCGDLVRDDLCVQYATSASCQTFFCPDCDYAGMCDFSCGYCDSRQGMSKSHTLTVKTTDFALLSSDQANKNVEVHWKTSSKITTTSTSPVTSADTVSYTAPASDSCAGRCGGTAPDGCECSPTCKIRGTCCADAGHCCTIGLPSSNAIARQGGCLRDEAVTLSVESASWGIKPDGVRTDFVNRFSTIYIELTGNKPIDVRSVQIGGVMVPDAGIAVEYPSMVSARQNLRRALTAYANSDDATFTAENTAYATRIASLPGAAYAWDGEEFSIPFPSIPSTLTALIKIDGSKLVPQPDGVLSYRVVYHERSGSPHFTDNAELVLTGTGPEWFNPPSIESVSVSLLASGEACNLAGTGAIKAAESTGLTLATSGTTVRTVVKFTSPVVVERWTVEGTEVHCRGSCHDQGLCEVDPHIVPPDTTDEAEYIDEWTSCREFDDKDIAILQDIGCGVRQFVRAVDKAGNSVQGERWSDTICFTLPADTTASELITVQGLTSCAKSATTKKFGPGCTASIRIEADGEIKRPTVQYADGGWANFPPACVLQATDPSSPTSAVWTLTCPGSVATGLPSGTLTLKISNLESTDGTDGTIADHTADSGYKGGDVDPIVVDNTAPIPAAAVPNSCALVIGDVATITVTMDEASWRPTVTAFGAQVTGVVSSTGATSGFHTTWVATASVPADWPSGSDIMPFIVTNAEDEVGNVNTGLYGNMYVPGTTQYIAPANVNCTVNTEGPRVTSATCANAVKVVTDVDAKIEVDFTTNVNVDLSFFTAGCVKIAGVDATVALNGSNKAFTATATKPTGGYPCDGEVSLSICEITDAAGNVGTTTVTKFFGPTSEACLIDNTAPEMQLIQISSDNPFDSKVATEGDTVTLYFEANEMITAPSITVEGVNAAADKLDVTGPAARRFPRVSDSTYSTVWIRKYTVLGSEGDGALTWSVTTHGHDKAGHDATLVDCADWNEATCSLLYSQQTAAQRELEPQIDFTGAVVQTFNNFLATTPSGNFTTLHSCYANSSSTTLSAANLNNLLVDLTRHDEVAASVYRHHIMSAQDFWWQRGGVCGTANGLMCRGTCGRCDATDVVMYNSQTSLTVANVTAPSGAAVTGDLCPGGSGVCMCEPQLGDGSLAKFLVSTVTRELVSRPTVKFTDIDGTEYVVPSQYVYPVSPVEWPDLPVVPCLSDASVRDGICDPDTRLNNRDGCWDGGDCCLDTCQQIFSDPAYCTSQHCRDHALSPITGRPTAGFWTSYNTKAAVSRQLSVEWMVEFPIDDTVPLVDGTLDGTVCCMQDKSGLDVLHATAGTFVAGEPCLDATLARDTSCLLSAKLTADNGLNVIKESEAVSLTLEFDGNPQNVDCSIAGVSVNMASTRNASGATTALRVGQRSSVNAIDAVMAQRIAATIEQRRRHELLPSVFGLNLWPNCTRGITIPFECTITDCGGNVFTVTDSVDPTADVCFDYFKPDAIEITQTSDGCNPLYAKETDVITTSVNMNTTTTPPTTATIAGATCTLAADGDSAFNCTLTVGSGTTEGFAWFNFTNVTGSEPAHLEAVNSSYIELKSIQPDGTVILGGQHVTVDITPPGFDNLQIYSLDTANKTCQKSCTARINIDSLEDLSTCTATIAGVAATITGSGDGWFAELEITTTVASSAGLTDGQLIPWSVTCQDMACNPVTVTDDPVGDTAPLVYYTSRRAPLEVKFYSDRPNRPAIASEDDCFLLEITFLDAVELAALTMGTVDDGLSNWNITTTGGASITVGNQYDYYLIQHCVADSEPEWGSSDWPVVPWSFTYGPSNDRVVWNTILTTDANVPASVKLDLEDPEPTYIYAYTSGAHDPNAGIGDVLYVNITADEAIVAPTVKFGDVTLNASDVVQQGSSSEWRAGPYLIRDLATDSNVLRDANDCFMFDIKLTDLVGHESANNNTQVNALGSENCTTERVVINQNAPTIVWLQTESVTATSVDFTLAVDQFSNVSWVVLERGSAEPTPLEVAAGTGASGVGAVASGVQMYVGSPTPSPGASAGGKGQIAIEITGLNSGTNYDVWFVPFDRFGNYEAEAQSRWIRTVGLDMLLDPVLLEEGGLNDVIHVKLTQVPTADVSVTISDSASLGDVELAIQTLGTSNFFDSVTLVFTPTDWNVAQEVVVRAVDDPYVEGTHGNPLVFAVSSLDTRYDNLIDPIRTVVIQDNDDCGVVMYDPTNRPRTLSCNSNSVVTLLNYTVDEDTTVYADVYLQSAARGDTVRVTLTSSDLTMISSPASVTLTFNESNYDLPQRVPIVPVYSCVAALDRYVPIQVTVDSASPCGGLVVPDIPVYINDLQTVGLTFSKTQIVGVPGNNYQFDMWLTSQPTSDVQVALTAVLNPLDASQQASVSFDCGSRGPVWTFDANDCSVPVTCLVTLVGDDTRCGDVTLSVVADVTSADLTYNSITSTPPSITILETANDAGWYIRDINNTNFIVTPPDAPNGTVPLAPWKVTEEIETGIYTITPTTALCKTVTIRPFVSTNYERFAVVTPRMVTLPAGFFGPTVFRVMFPRNWNVHRPNEVIELWHDIVYSTDDPDYLALSPNLGGSALPVEIVEYDTPGLLLGNGARNTVLVDEPCPDSAVTQVSSLGFTLRSAPLADVTVSLSEMIYNDTYKTSNLGGASKHLVLGTNSLTFTPNNWNIPQPVMVSAISYDNITESRAGYVCGQMASSDAVYAALNETCYPVHICDCSGSCGTLTVDNPTNCVMNAPIKMNNSDTELQYPSAFKQLSSCWNITGSCNGNVVSDGVDLDSRATLTYTTLPSSEVYTDLSKVQHLVKYGSAWNVMDTTSSNGFPLSEITGGLQGEIIKTGVYCLGLSQSAFLLNNTGNGGLFLEKSDPLNMFANSFEILPSASSTFDSDIYTLDVDILSGSSPLTDGYELNCTDGGNMTAPGGCLVSDNLNAYFNNATQVIRFTNCFYLPDDCASGVASTGRRLLGRELLQFSAPASSQDFVWAINNITFSDISLDPTGSTRMVQTRVVDQYGAIVEGPILAVDTEGVNDNPIIDIDLPIVYTEKESLQIEAPYQAYDVDNVNWTSCVVNITDRSNNFMPGDTFSYNKTAIVEKYQYWNTTIPAGFVDIDATFADDQRTVTFAGEAPPASYLRAMKNLVLLNDGPAMTDDDRYITFCCYDPEPENSEGCGVQRVVFQPVNDPPLSEPKIYYIPDPKVDEIIGELLPGSDPDGDTFTFNISCTPERGTFTFDENTGAFSYTPDRNVVGNDKFVYFTWDGYDGPDIRPLQSKFATVDIRMGNGDTDPVAQDMIIEVWENSPESITFDAIDADSTDTAQINDIARFQIYTEPELNPSGIVLQSPVTSSGRRYSENATFEYGAYSGSDIVQRVRQKMANYGTNFDFSTLARESHPGFNVTYFQYVAIDLSGRVSNVANVYVWLRLISETNVRPSANPMTFNINEQELVEDNFDTTDTESPAQLRHSLPASGVQPTLGIASQVGIAQSPYTKAFKYEPYPFYYGTDTFEYLVTDPHGSTSDLTLVTVNIALVDQPPQGACAENSTLKSSSDPQLDFKGRMAELSTLTAYRSVRARIERYINNPERRDLEFYHYTPFINDLGKFDNVIAQENVFMSCGSSTTTTPAAIYHDEVVAVALVAYDVDQPLSDTIEYVLSEEPKIDTTGARGVAGYAGTLYPYVAPTGTFYNVTNMTLYSYDPSVTDTLTAVTAGDIIASAGGSAPLLLFQPREFIHGPVTFKWHAVDTSTGARGDDVTMTIHAKCRGGERVNVDTCDLCPPGYFNSANIPDQQSCIKCPVGTYTASSGATVCKPCPADTYADFEGAEVCTPCPIHKRSPTGSDAESDCMCDIGFVVLNSTRCKPCALDRQQCTEFNQYMPLPYDGYWQDATAGGRNLSCVPGVACVAKESAEEVREGACAPARFTSGDPGYTGEACDTCAPDHYRYASFCEKCDAEPAVRIFFIVLGYAAALYVIFELAGHRAIPALTILLTFMQITAQMQYFEVPWPKVLARWMQNAALTVADLQLLGLDCVSNFDYFTRFGATMFAPFAWLFVVAIAVFLRSWKEIVNHAVLNVKKRRLIERRRKLAKFDMDADKWTEIAIARDGMPFDRPDLRGKGDDYNALEKHLYGVTQNENLRRRVYKESVEELRRADLQAASRKDKSAAEKKLLQTKEEVARMVEQMRVQRSIIRANINRAIPSTVIIIWWGYMLLARTAIEFFECKTNGETARLVAAPEVACNVGRHLNFKPIAFAGFVLYPIGLPLLAGYWLYKHRSSSKTTPRVHVLASTASKIEQKDAALVELFESRYGMLYQPLRPRFYMWVCIDLLKKFCIVGVKVIFPNNVLMQSFISIVAFATFGILATRNPYVSTHLNIAEMLATFMNTITLIAGFYFQLGIMSDTSTEISTYVVVAGLAATTLILAFIVTIEFLPWMKRLMFLIKYKTQTEMYKPDKIGTHESGPQGTSCYLFPSDSPMRYWCWRAVRHPLFDRLVTVAVFLSLGTIIAEGVLYDADFITDAYIRITWFTTAVNCVFFAEAAMKIIALGFILGDGAYLRDTFNCIDFLVIVLQFMLVIVNIATNVAGARSARFVKFVKLARIRYFRLFRRMLRMHALRGDTLRLLVLEAKAEDPPEIEEAIQRLHVVFEPSSAEVIEYRLRVLPPDVLRLARGLIEEMYHEKFDADLVAVYESQTDPVKQTVQKQYQGLVYEWLATVAEPGQKRAFMNTLKTIRDVGLDLGPEGVAEEMIRQQYPIGEILNAEIYKEPEGVKTTTKDYKRKLKKGTTASSFTSSKALISKQYTAVQAAITSDDKVEDALNALPLHSVDEDQSLVQRQAELDAVKIRNKTFDADEAAKLVRERFGADSAPENGENPSTEGQDADVPVGPAPVKSAGVLAKFRRKK